MGGRPLPNSPRIWSAYSGAPRLGPAQEPPTSYTVVRPLAASFLPAARVGPQIQAQCPRVRLSVHPCAGDPRSVRLWTAAGAGLKRRKGFPQSGGGARAVPAPPRAGQSLSPGWPQPQSRHQRARGVDPAPGNAGARPEWKVRGSRTRGSWGAGCKPQARSSGPLPSHSHPRPLPRYRAGSLGPRRPGSWGAQPPLGRKAWNLGICCKSAIHSLATPWTLGT